MKNRQSTSANGQKYLFPLFLIGAGVVLIFGVIIWQALMNTPSAPATNSSQSGIPFPEIQRISLVDAKVAYDQQSAIFLDVRDASSFAAGHIAGAISMPLTDLPDRLGELDPNQLIIPYCT